MMKGPIGIFRETYRGGKDRWPRRTRPGGPDGPPYLLSVATIQGACSRETPGVTNRPPAQVGRRRAVFDLVRWSFVVALTPLALNLAWRLILLIASSIAVGFTRPSLDEEPRGPLQTVSRQRRSSSISLPGWT